jgi:hypothetical protein
MRLRHLAVRHHLSLGWRGWLRLDRDPEDQGQSEGEAETNKEVRMRLVFHVLLLPCLCGWRSGGQRGGEAGLPAMRADAEIHDAPIRAPSPWVIDLP